MYAGINFEQSIHWIGIFGLGAVAFIWDLFFVIVYDFTRKEYEAQDCLCPDRFTVLCTGIWVEKYIGASFKWRITLLYF